MKERKERNKVIVMKKRGPRESGKEEKYSEWLGRDGELLKFSVAQPQNFPSVFIHSIR